MDKTFKENELVQNLIMVFVNMGEDISVWSNKNIITVRKIKAISYIIVNNEELIVSLNNKQYIVKDGKDIKKLESKIEKVYDEN